MAMQEHEWLHQGEYVDCSCSGGVFATRHRLVGGVTLVFSYAAYLLRWRRVTCCESIATDPRHFMQKFQAFRMREQECSCSQRLMSFDGEAVEHSISAFRWVGRR